MSIRVRVVCAGVVMGALVVGLGAASASASALGHGSRASVATRHRPPILKAGEEWSLVTWKFDSGILDPCNAEFGVVGTQVCDGAYAGADGPRPEFGGWGFHDQHDGTVKSSREARHREIDVNFYTPGAEILGQIPSEESDSYTVTSAQGPGWRIESPAFSRDYYDIAPGQKGGPLKLNVGRGRASPFGDLFYSFAVDGWVVVIHR